MSDLAGGSQCFEPKPHGQLPAVPQPCRGGRPSFTGQQAQQPVFCPLCVPSGPVLPARREQPLHPGRYLQDVICSRLFCDSKWMWGGIAFYRCRSDLLFDHSVTPPGSPMAIYIWVIQWKESLRDQVADVNVCSLSRWSVSAQMCFHPPVPSPGPSPPSLAALHPHTGLRRSTSPWSL